MISIGVVLDDDPVELKNEQKGQRGVVTIRIKINFPRLVGFRMSSDYRIIYFGLEYLFIVGQEL